MVGKIKIAKITTDYEQINAEVQGMELYVTLPEYLADEVDRSSKFSIKIGKVKYSGVGLIESQSRSTGYSRVFQAVSWK